MLTACNLIVVVWFGHETAFRVRGLVPGYEPKWNLASHMLLPALLTILLCLQVQTTEKPHYEYFSPSELVYLSPDSKNGNDS